VRACGNAGWRVRFESGGCRRSRRRTDAPETLGIRNCRKSRNAHIFSSPETPCVVPWGADALHLGSRKSYGRPSSNLVVRNFASGESMAVRTAGVKFFLLLVVPSSYTLHSETHKLIILRPCNQNTQGRLSAYAGQFHIMKP